MGDSDDDIDSRRNRDKFRRERDDFSGNRAPHHRGGGGGEWNDGRDRSNQFRRQYPGPPVGPPPRFNRNPVPYDMSPPQNKRFRRDWDGSDQPPPSRFDQPIQDTTNKESLDGTSQPPLLSFKSFLLDQDDNIDQEEAVKRYGVYKNDFKKTQIAEFFTAHKDEEWFKYKYHPDEFPKRRDEQRQIIQKRLDIFMDLYNKGYLKDVVVDIDNQRVLTRFLDAAVIKMEGGTDHDLRVLDTDNEGEGATGSETSKDLDAEAGEVPDAPRSLHRTASIFFRHLAMQTTKEELENLCKQYEGFRRVCITDPAPERKFARRGWATFDHTVQIRNICYEFNSTKLHDVDIGAIINRELKNRFRSINGIGQHKTIVRNDLRLISKVIKQLDERWNIWGSVDQTDVVTAPSSTDDSEISSSTTNISTMKNKNPTGFVSYNPLLKNITEYLVEEGDAEEDEEQSNTFETDSELAKVLDCLIVYLRVVYSVDYYNGSEYAQEDAMPNRCGVMHVRGSALTSATATELTNFMQQSETRLKPFLDYQERLDEEEAVKLGAKNEDEEVEKFMNANCQEVGKDKWSCPLSGKKFKGPEFVRKHILNKHQDKIDEVKKEMMYFNNYLYDPKRPQLPEHPSNRTGAASSGPNPSGLPLPTPMGAQPLLTRPPLWPSMPAPLHPGPANYYPNHFHQQQQQHHHHHPRPSFMYHGGGGGGPPGGPPHRGPNRPIRSYEDLDAPNEI